ncbi:Phosphoglycolate phosphatase [Magnetospirillum gryphiswaldense MSR-1 v2]|uniref:Phosphoglycolate phosphatase n=1 Tax=Magnetospirillum gryphiswaldense (strain DSM 6361 / JCM 21280 / NBRC 15271 / MSR-1) TaxID=431944 RepID=V6F5D0_MAGGM|nr:HAD family hydrolase [Magnetospirillum gryphiswaldense]CDL00654.1 Phosphoglycolate phosphatase [Magnetospirillum gryphiswaldense MSR-1 v2]
MKRAVLFDLDGTLIDSVPDVRLALNAMLSQRARRPLALDEVRQMVGEGAQVMLERAFAATGAAGGDMEQALRDYLAAYAAAPVVETVLYPGAMECMRRLVADGNVLGICTNKPSSIAVLVIRELGLDGLIAGYTGGDSLPFRKPDGRHLQATLECMGVAGSPAILVGDSETDVAAARDFGMPVVAVSFGYADNAEMLGADRVISHFRHLPLVVAELMP